METTHRVAVSDSRQMADVDDGVVDIVITSPPYPMIEMWDDVFGDLNPTIEDDLAAGAGQLAFDRMHDELNRTWSEVERVLTDGGLACINIGDATRKIDGNFRVYQNHARVIDDLTSLGFEPLPDILWRKPTNSAAKFMGSGMLPPNAYVTLEHEYLLIFRKGKTSRSFEPGAERRYSSAYFWEERNEWFSDVWTDIRGTFQALDTAELRERSAAFPFAVPYRLLNMYSVYGDTVLDPFWGTGTTSLAAMVAGRNSIGYERERQFAAVFDERVSELETMSHHIITKRIDRHEEFVRKRQQNGEPLEYSATHYGFPVMTKQETEIQFYTVTDVANRDTTYTVCYDEFPGSDGVQPAKTPNQSTFESYFH